MNTLVSIILVCVCVFAAKVSHGCICDTKPPINMPTTAAWVLSLVSAALSLFAGVFALALLSCEFGGAK